jgi:hypothetical protein
MPMATWRFARFAASLLCMTVGLTAGAALSAIPAGASDAALELGSPGCAPAPYAPLEEVAVEQRQPQAAKPLCRPGDGLFAVTRPSSTGAATALPLLLRRRTTLA